MRVKKLLKTTVIAVGSLVVLLVLGVSVLVFNPLEGSLADMRDVVPRDVDFFVRKVDLRDDFAEGEFPEPLFWADVRGHREWARVEQGPAYAAINGRGQLTELFEGIRAQVESIRTQSRGHLDLLEDVLGHEVEVAGKLGDSGQGNPGSSGSPGHAGHAGFGGARWCAYARVSWKAKFLWGLLGYGFVQEQLRQNGVGVRADDRLLVFEPQGAAPLYGARYLDCLLVGNDRDLVRRSLDLASGVGDADSFGGSARYRDGIEQRLEEWEAKNDATANAVEFFLRTDELLSRPDVTWDDGWPDANHPDSMNTRVLASFLNLDSWLSLTGALMFEPESLSLIADVELNQNKHTPFQAQFFRTEQQHRSEWLDPFLAMVPANACALAALRMPAGEFLREMYSALDSAQKELINDGLRGTGQWKDALELISALAPALHPRTGFVFRMNQPDEQIPVADPDPSVPQIAWVFWMRKGAHKVLSDFVETITKHREVLQFTNAWDLSLGLGGRGVGGDAAREFTNPQIPGTGSIATLVYPPFFVVSNSGPFIRDMMLALILPDHPSVLALEDFQEYVAELPDAVNALVYVNGSELEKLLLRYQQAIASASTLPDPAWAMQRRPTAENEVFRRDYAARYRSLAAIPAEVKAQFDADVDRELTAMWTREQASYTADDRSSLQQLLGLNGMFRSAYLQVILEARHLQLTGRALARW